MRQPLPGFEKISNVPTSGVGRMSQARPLMSADNGRKRAETLVFALALDCCPELPGAGPDCAGRRGFASIAEPLQHRVFDV
jgi:hypothetical protein